MGELLNFRSRDVRHFRRKTEYAKASTSAAKLAYRNKPERYKPVGERVVVTNPEECTPSILFAIGGFKAALRELDRKFLVNFEDFPEDLEFMRKENQYLPERAMRVVENLPEHTQAEIVLAMARNIHDGWVYDHSSDFFGYFLDYEYVYLPLELIGVDQLNAVFRPLEKALPRFGLSAVSWEMLVQVFDEAREEFKKHHHIRTLNDLTDAIVRIGSEYASLKPEVAEVMKTRAMAFEIARQVMYRSAEIFRHVSKAV